MLSWDEWLGIGMVAAPLIAKAFSDWNANAVANHNSALARITGMASRSAAEIALTLASLPPGANPLQAKTALIANARAAIATEMADSLKVIKAGDGQVSTILSGEVAKVLVPAVLPPGVAVVLPPGFVGGATA